MMKTNRQAPKHIIISHVYSSDNKGDAALTSVLVQDLKRKFKDAKITIVKFESVKENDTFEGVPEKPSFMYYAVNKYHHLFAKLIYALYMMSATLLWALWYRYTGKRLYLPRHLRETAELYEQADLIVPVGGGYIRSRPGLVNRFNIPLLLHPLLFGYLLRKPTILYSQSVGPFQNKFERGFVAAILKRMNLILLREDTSLSLLKSLGVTKNVTRAIDSGFLLKSRQKLDIRKAYQIPSEKLLIGVTVRAWLSGAAQSRYEKAVAEALDTVIEKVDAYVIFIPQVTATKGDDDRLVSRRVHQLMRHATVAMVVNDTPDHHQIKAMYDQLDILLGTRFHSVIFSLTSHVPVVAIEYEHKTSGIMRDLQLEDWVIKIEHVTASNLSSLLLKLIRKQTVYRAELRRSLPPYISRARQTIDLLSAAYEK